MKLDPVLSVAPKGKTVFPSTAQRVADNTAEPINARIRQQTKERISRYSKDDPAAIRSRLAELDREWDIERALEANAATVSLVGLSLGAAVDRRWFMLPARRGRILAAACASRMVSSGACHATPRFPHPGGDRSGALCTQGAARRFRRAVVEPE
ncbi:MAG TPA: hypothetical protein VHC22_07540 [Pirellulales bacterium]|nr:hypothetical protein [Pirellulales bacterium]